MGGSKGLARFDEDVSCKRGLAARWSIAYHNRARKKRVSHTMTYVFSFCQVICSSFTNTFVVSILLYFLWGSRDLARTADMRKGGLSFVL